MKKKLLFLTVLLTLGTYTLIAQEPPHPPSDPSLGGGNGPIGGGPTGAPVDGGLGILLVFGVAYAVKKVLGSHKVHF